MCKAFISYSSKDQQKAMNFCNLLEKQEVPCWIAPRNIPVGSNYTKTIPTAISSCPVFIVLLTENAQNSRFVLKELEYAVSSGKLIIPVLLEDFSLNEEFRFLVGVEHHLAAFQMHEDAVAQALVSRVRNTEWIPPPTNPPASTVDLTVIRTNQFFVIDTPVVVTTSDGAQKKLKNNSTVTIPLPTGMQQILFTGSIRKTKIRINLSSDTTLIVKWNRITGHIQVETLSQTDFTVLEEK